MIRILLPTHLGTLAQTGREITLEVAGTPTVDAVLDALEARYPMLCGTIRDQVTKERRPFIRFFYLSQDWSHEPTSLPLPEAVTSGTELFRVVGAMAGG